MNRPPLYSYNRVSTPEQRKGRGGRRQTEDAERWAKENGYEVDQTLNLSDTGSGYHGDNLTRGALGKFVALVKKGQIERGSVLFLENLDRLTRSNMMTANRLVLDLLEGGIRLVWLDAYDGTTEELTSEIVNRDPGRLNHTLDILRRANGESERKSRLGKRSWEMKRDDIGAGYRRKHKCPEWLKWKQDEDQKRRWKVDPEQAKHEAEDGEYLRRDPQWGVVRRIVDAYLSGQTMERICHELNLDEVPTFGPAKAWTVACMGTMLSNSALKGERIRRIGGKKTRRSERKQIGEPVPNYYPALLTDAEWHKMRSIKAANKCISGRPGANGRVNNLFQGRLYDLTDGSPVYRRTGDRPFLVSKHALSGPNKSDYTSYNYDVYEWSILQVCDEVEPGDLIPLDASPDLKADLDRAEAETAAAKSKLESLRQKMSDGDEDVIDALLPVAQRAQASVRAGELQVKRFRSRLLRHGPRRHRRPRQTGPGKREGSGSPPWGVSDGMERLRVSDGRILLPCRPVASGGDQDRIRRGRGRPGPDGLPPLRTRRHLPIRCRLG